MFTKLISNHINSATPNKSYPSIVRRIVRKMYKSTVHIASLVTALLFIPLLLIGEALLGENTGKD